ncbi:hypothetical protein D3C76_896810 [compost metagenome]
MVQLEVTFVVQHTDFVAQLAQLIGQQTFVHGVNFVLNHKNVVIEQGAPFAIGPLCHVHDHGVGMHLRIFTTAHFMAKFANDHVPRSLPHGLALFLAASLSKLFNVLHGLGHCAIMGEDN